MKKSLAAVALSASLFSPIILADTFFGIYAGAQAWYMDTEGGFANSETLTNFNFDSETKSNFYVAIEHPIPLVPNIKVVRTNMDSNGVVDLTASFDFGNQTFASNTLINTDVSLDSTDATFYYEIFDNDLVSFDIGLTGKYLDGDLFVVDAGDSTLSARETFSGVIPMLYSRIAVGLPVTNLGFFVEGNFLAVDDHTISDYQVALMYGVLDNIAVDMAIQLGYREFQIELDDLDDVYSDIKFSGVFAGVEVHF